MCLQLKLPGVARLKLRADKQQVAEPCAPIPSLADDAVRSEQAVVPVIPTVDEIHTRTAIKLGQKNAIALGSSAGVSNGGRVGAAQVLPPFCCSLSCSVFRDHVSSAAVMFSQACSVEALGVVLP